MIKRCEICGKEFDARRSTARFCSSTCRSRSYRAYAYYEKHGKCHRSVSMSDDSVLEILNRAHTVASDLSRASMMTTAPLCLSLKKVSKKIEDALREEGL